MNRSLKIISATLAVILVIIAGCAIGKKDMRAQLIDLVPDDATMAMMLDQREFYSEFGNPAPIARLTSTVWPFLDNWSNNFVSFKGLDRANILLMTSPRDLNIIIVPVNDFDALEKSMEAASYHHYTDKATGWEIFVPADMATRSAVVEDNTAWFLSATDPTTLIADVQFIKERAKEEPLAQWKRESLMKPSAIKLIQRNFIDQGLFAEFDVTIKDEYLNGEIQMRDSLGTPLPLNHNGMLEALNPEIITMLPDDCFLTAAMSVPDTISELGIMGGFAPASIDSLTHLAADFLNHADGTTAMSISYRGITLYDLQSYQLVSATEMDPGVADTLADALFDRFMAHGFDLPFAITALNDVITMSIGSNDSATLSHRDVDVDGLIGYIVLDITPKGPIASSLGRPVKMQLQVRVSPDNIRLYATVNEEAIDVITQAVLYLSAQKND